jgi:hypothetical protein
MSVHASASGSSTVATSAGRIARAWSYPAAWRFS